MDANAIKNTISLCPECYREIPASVYARIGQAVMVKTCPEHGTTESIVESDVEFYGLVQRNNAPMFYSGLIIDVTYRCNLRCKWCFQKLGNDDVPKERIYSLASQMPKGHNIILSGGEPTIRNDLREIVETLVSMGYCTNVITNGFKLDWSLPCRWTLSHHPESQILFNQRIAAADRMGKKFASIIYTDNSLDDYYAHVQQALKLGHICEVFRMHAAAPVAANADDHTSGIFVSDMYRMLAGKGHQLQMFPPKTIFVPVVVDSVPFMLISWQTVHNVDILENMAEPWYHGRGNTVDNLVNRLIRDERC